MNKLCHNIEDKLTNDYENLTTETIRNVISEYDSINETNEFMFISFIKKRITTRYKGKRILPNALNCTNDFEAKRKSVITSANASMRNVHAVITPVPKTSPKLEATTSDIVISNSV